MDSSHSIYPFPVLHIVAVMAMPLTTGAATDALSDGNTRMTLESKRTSSRTKVQVSREVQILRPCARSRKRGDKKKKSADQIW
jgi:hypothetical protein